MKYGDTIQLKDGTEAIFLNSYKDRGTIRYLIQGATVRHIKESSVKKPPEPKSLLTNRCNIGDRIEYTIRGKRKGQDKRLGKVKALYLAETTGSKSAKQDPKLVWFVDVIDEITGSTMAGVYESSCCVVGEERPYYWESDPSTIHRGSRRIHDRVISTQGWSANYVCRDEF